MSFNRIRYFLHSGYFGKIEIEEPLNWNSDDKELMRSDKNEGIIKSLSGEMQFHGYGREQLKTAYSIDGIKAIVKIIREYRNDLTDIWEFDYSGWLDFSTYKENTKIVGLKVYEDRFFKQIESNFKTKFELNRTTDVNGNPIGDLVFDEIELTGREIFRESSLEAKPYIYYFTNPAAAYAIPVEVLNFKSDDNVFATAISSDSNGLINLDQAKVFDEFGNFSFSAGQFFYIDAQNENTMTLKITGRVVLSCQGDFSTNVNFLVYGIKKDENGNYNPTDLNGFNFSPNILLLPNQQVEIIIDHTEDYVKRLGDNIAIIINSTIPTLNFFIRFYDFKISIDETEPSRTSACKALTVNNAVNRLTQIITGKNSYLSNVLNDFWKDLYITNGFLIRQIPDKTITLSLEEILTGLNCIDDIVWTIENEIIRVESLNFVYDNSSFIDIGKLANIERELISDLHYSKIKIGFDFNGEYEDVIGLDEFNIENQYTTPIDVQENEIDLVSKVLADSYGITLAQLKPFETNPKLDTKYDKENYFLDCKSDKTVRLWRDDFESAPTGIFSPDTAFNLRLSPVNSLLRKGRSVSVGFQKYQNENIRYSSTEGNSQLVTVYAEKINEPVSIFAKPYILPELITGVCEMSFNKFSEIIRNKYKMIKFDNEFGFVKSIKLNGNTANIVLIKANR